MSNLKLIADVSIDDAKRAIKESIADQECLRSKIICVMIDKVFEELEHLRQAASGASQNIKAVKEGLVILKNNSTNVSVLSGTIEAYGYEAYANDLNKELKFVIDVLESIGSVLDEQLTDNG